MIHLDETSRNDIEQKFVPMLDGLPSNTSSTVLLLALPQKLARETRVCDALMRCAVAGTFRLVAIDEVHLYTLHGCTFRDSIWFLRDNFFRRLVEYRILFLAMTATMSVDLLKDFFALTHVNWEDEHHQMWASPRDFCQREIKMELHPTGEITQLALKPVVEILVSDAEAHVYIF